MAIKCGYYNSSNGDRKYNAETMAVYFSGLFTRGVLQNYGQKFVVTEAGGMKVKVPTGKAYFSDGKWIENTADIVLTLDPADVVLNRIDSIVLRNDKNESVRDATVVLKKGTPATNPVAPGIDESDSYIEELLLCNIRINKLAENITQANITNTIPNTDVCGYVTGIIKQVDTSDLYKQYETAYKEFQDKSKEEFQAWFDEVKDSLATTTIIRTFKNTYVTQSADEKVILIGIPQYRQAIDILDVYINGLRLNGTEYTINKDRITLTLPVDVETPIEFVVYKSVDGSDAENVLDQVERLERVVNTGSYVATGTDDNIKLSEIIQEFLNGGNDYKQLEIDVYGELSCTKPYKGTGLETDPVIWFMVGQKETTTRRVRLNFAHCDRISIDNANRINSVMFYGNDVDIRNCQGAMYNATSSSVFSGERVNCKDSEFWINASTSTNQEIVGGGCCGTFTRCRFSVTGGIGKAYGFKANGGMLKLTECEVIVYNVSSSASESVGVVVEANKTENVLIMEKCNLPIRDRGGYKQSNTVKVNSGYCSLTSNVMGKAPALYSTDANKCSNIGTLVISK